MGIPRPKNLESLRKMEADLLVRCRGCGREAAFGLLAILNHFRMMGWNTAWEAVGRRFRCVGNDQERGCGGRDIALSWVPREKPPPPEPLPNPRAIKEAIRRARG